MKDWVIVSRSKTVIHPEHTMHFPAIPYSFQATSSPKFSMTMLVCSGVREWASCSKDGPGETHLGKR
jgi:hypothetical protein